MVRADLLVAADHRIEFARARRLGQVAREFLERIVAILGGGGVGGAAAAQRGDRGVDAFGRDAGSGERLAGGRGGRQRTGEQQPLDGDVAVASLLGDLLGGIEQADEIIVELRRLLRAATRDLRYLGERGIGVAQRDPGVAAGLGDQARGHAFAVFEQCLQQMLGRDALVVHADRDGLRGLQEALGAIGEFFEVHEAPLEIWSTAIWCCLYATQGSAAYLCSGEGRSVGRRSPRALHTAPASAGAQGSITLGSHRPPPPRAPAARPAGRSSRAAA